MYLSFKNVINLVIYVFGFGSCLAVIAKTKSKPESHVQLKRTPSNSSSCKYIRKTFMVFIKFVLIGWRVVL